MHKQEFLDRLQAGLAGLPQADIEERLNFYHEMIADAMEEGLSEEEAVASVGSVGQIVNQIVAEIPLGKLAKEKMKSKRLKTWEIILLVLGSPVWFSLLAAAAAVALAIYISWWAVVISAWAVTVSVAASSIGGTAAGVLLLCQGNMAGGIVMLAGAIVCAGLAIFAFYGCKSLTGLTLKLTGKLIRWTKNRFVKKEEA